VRDLVSLQHAPHFILQKRPKYRLKKYNKKRASMTLATKFNLFLLFTFAFCLSVGGFYSYRLTKNNALQQITDQAELIMQEALAVRSYTVNEIRPLLKKLGDEQFHPQTVPAYSATQVANLVRKNRPDYFYKEAVFNPTNPRDKATLQEVDIINRFINAPDIHKQIGDIKINGQQSLYIAFPIKITNPKCLTCHSKPEAAPAAMRAIYGDDGGFGWNLNEIVGAQMVVVPYKLPAELAQKTFYSFMIALGVLFLVLFLTLNYMIRKLVLNPVRMMTFLADDLSKGNISGDEVNIQGKDEIADLSRSFNRMRRSVIKIIQILRKNKTQNKPQA
jgi:protein-histidine pros-kinase